MSVASKRGIVRKRGPGGRRQRACRSSRSTLTHLPKHLRAAIMSYRRQVELSGDLDPTIRQLLDRIDPGDTRESVMARLVAFDHSQIELKAGTILSREWNGTVHRAIAVEDGFLWAGTKYDSLSAIAFAITGTRWNGPRFFGLRDSAAAGEDGP